jgi:hypothetical protein
MSYVHLIDGCHYVEINRKAIVGDFVVRDGILRRVTGINEVDDYVEFEQYVDDEGDYVCGWGTGSYKTLEPLVEEATVDTTQASPEVINLLANLARRVASLEDQLRSTQRNLETSAEELANTRHRLAKHADRFAAIEDKVEMLTDDIVELDSRSQVLNAINKYYAEGSR